MLFQQILRCTRTISSISRNKFENIYEIVTMDGYVEKHNLKESHLSTLPTYLFPSNTNLFFPSTSKPCPSPPLVSRPIPRRSAFRTTVRPNHGGKKGGDGQEGEVEEKAGRCRLGRVGRPTLLKSTIDRACIQYGW